jgi:predicted transcriptional regulator
MAETTTIRLTPELRARLARIAKETNRSVHSIIIDGIERYATYEEELRGLAKNAPLGKVYRAEDVHAWAERLARGEAPPFPAPIRK